MDAATEGGHDEQPTGTPTGTPPAAEQAATYALDMTRADVVVVGTGLAESVIAASAAAAGRSVVHVDRNTHYGGPYATFTLTELEALVHGSARPASARSSTEPTRPARLTT